MDKLAKARKLAEHNHYLRDYLDLPLKGKQDRYKKKREQLAETMNELARVFCEPPEPFILTSPTFPHHPLKLPPHAHKLKKVSTIDKVKEQLAMIEKKKTTKRGRKPTEPSLRYYQELAERQNQKPYQTENPPHYQTEEHVEDILTTTTTITTIDDDNNDNNVNELLTHTSTNITGEDTNTDRNTFTDNDKVQTASYAHKSSIGVSLKGEKSLDKSAVSISHQSLKKNTTERIKKLSHATPIIYNMKELQSKTALTLVRVYSQELTPDEIDLMLSYRDELKLTHSEIVALSLLKDMDSEDTEKAKESAKQYWKIQETMEKSRKTATPINQTNSTLLEQKLADAQEAIFGEIIEKPVDNK